MLRCALILLVLVFSVAVQSVVLTIPDESLANGVVAGAPFSISWTNADGAIGLFLVNGITNSIAAVIAFDLTGQTSYIWTPSTSLPNTIYKFEIGDTAAAPAYSNLFNLTGGGLPTSTSSQTTFITSTISSKSIESSSASQSNYRTHSITFSRTHTGSPSTRTHPPQNCSSSSCSKITSVPPPPLPPRCSTTCMRNLNDTRVTHTANTELASATSASAKAMTKSTQKTELSESAKVAIGVGAAVASAIVAVLLVLTFWQGKKIGKESAERESDPRYVMHGAGGVYEEEKAPVELDTSTEHNILEIDGRRREWDARGNG